VLHANTEWQVASNPCLQTKEGNEAQALTAQEAEARANATLAKARREYRKDPAAFGNKLRFSWDGASAHKAARDMIALLPEQFVDPPAHSPDLQRAVETPHSRIHKMFIKRLSVDPRIHSVQAAIKLLLEVAKDACDAKYIRKLYDSLPNTYRSILENKGNWAEKKYR
jgi:hypothetical protein